MPQRPVAPEPGRDEDPGRAEEDWLAWCEAVEEQLGPDEDEPEDAAPWDADIDALIAECRQVTAEEAAFAARAARRGLPGGTPVADGRRGPGQPGSARASGRVASPAAGFGPGMALDVLPGCAPLAVRRRRRRGRRPVRGCPEPSWSGRCAWDRVEAHAAARKLAAVAELRRRRVPAPAEGPAQLPESWRVHRRGGRGPGRVPRRRRRDAGPGADLETRLPGTRAALRDGVLRQAKAEIIARATALLDPAEAARPSGGCWTGPGG